jgi:hypothetical protein
MAWDDEHPGLRAGVDRQGHGHSWKDDGVVQRDQQVLLHDAIHAPQVVLAP